MKLAINGALTIGTEDGANIEMRQQVTDPWWPFSFGCSAQEIEKIRSDGSYRPGDISEKNYKIRRAVDTLRDRTFANDDDEHQAFCDLYHKLLEGHYGGAPDRYFTLKDLESYAAAQARTDKLYLQPNKWAQTAISNITRHGYFFHRRISGKLLPENLAYRSLPA